jgi:predicted nuclease with RNAse H fold
VSGAPAVGLDPKTGSVLWQSDELLFIHAVVDDELIASRDQQLLVFRDATAEIAPDSMKEVRQCPDCDEDLRSYNDPQHCPNCGTVLGTN